MIRSVRPLYGVDLKILRPQKAQDHIDADDERWKYVQDSGHSFSGLRDGYPIVCAGIVPQWHGRAISWSIISEQVGRYDMVWIHRQVKKFLDDTQEDPAFRRIEMTVAHRFCSGNRWAEMLGFKSEGVMPCYGPNGEAHELYARIANGC